MPFFRSFVEATSLPSMLSAVGAAAQFRPVCAAARAQTTEKAGSRAARPVRARISSIPRPRSTAAPAARLPPGSVAARYSPVVPGRQRRRCPCRARRARRSGRQVPAQPHAAGDGGDSRSSAPTQWQHRSTAASTAATGSSPSASPGRTAPPGDVRRVHLGDHRVVGPPDWARPPIGRHTEVGLDRDQGPGGVADKRPQVPLPSPGPSQASAGIARTRLTNVRAASA